jgi:single-strand DNA-binding protein
MTNFNLTIIEGRLTKDCELRHTSKGTAMITFTIANNYYKMNEGKKEQQVCYYDVVAWDNLAEIMANYLKKGIRVIVSGKFQMEKYTTKTGEERISAKVIANNIDFVSQTDNKFQKNSNKVVA